MSSLRPFLALLVLAVFFAPAGAAEPIGFSEDALGRLKMALPATAADCRDAKRCASVEKTCREVVDWAARVGTLPEGMPLDEVLNRTERVVAAKALGDRWLDDTFALRTQFVTDKTAEQRDTLRHYLRIVSALSDLSGRLRFQLEDTINEAAFRLASRPALRDKLVDSLIKQQSGIGGEVMAWLLFDPPPNAENGAQPASVAAKRRVLQLIAATGGNEVVPLLARFLREEKRFPELVVLAADALRKIGLPQDLRPGDGDAMSRPPVTAADLLPIVRGARVSDPAVAAQRDELLRWLEARAAKGLADDTYRIGTFDVQPGDWMLMRNPSPYNLFTDLSPGIFTHVGVVVAEKGTDGRRRMVVVDVPERGTHLRPTNVDVIVRQARHCMFVRHTDPKIAQQMADVALSVINNESVFDLNYRIDHVTALKGQPKQGKVIKSYCAGLLMLCCQETPIAPAKFFPVIEKVAGGNMEKNLKIAGVAIGDRFVSPTGPLFSQELTIVGRRPPSYLPSAEIEEGVFDHFAACMRERELLPAQDPLQAARVTLAEASKDNPAVKRMLAQLNNVNPNMDLVSAAKAAAVVENLDRAAFGASRDFRDAYLALSTGPLEQLKPMGYTDQDLARFQQLRQQHASLYRAYMKDGDLRTLREALIAHYIKQGRTEVEKRFKQ